MEPLIPRGSRVYVSGRAELREMDAGLFLYDGRVICRRWCEDYNGALILLGADESRREDCIYLNRGAAQTLSLSWEGAYMKCQGPQVKSEVTPKS